MGPGHGTVTGFWRGQLAPPWVWLPFPRRGLCCLQVLLSELTLLTCLYTEIELSFCTLGEGAQGKQTSRCCVFSPWDIWWYSTEVQWVPWPSPVTCFSAYTLILGTRNTPAPLNAGTYMQMGPCRWPQAAFPTLSRLTGPVVCVR